MNKKDPMDNIRVWKAIVEITQISANALKNRSWLFYIPETRSSFGLEALLNIRQVTLTF